MAIFHSFWVEACSQFREFYLKTFVRNFRDLKISALNFLEFKIAWNEKLEKVSTAPSDNWHKTKPKHRKYIFAQHYVVGRELGGCRWKDEEEKSLSAEKFHNNFSAMRRIRVKERKIRNWENVARYASHVTRGVRRMLQRNETFCSATGNLVVLARKFH